MDRTRATVLSVSTPPGEAPQLVIRRDPGYYSEPIRLSASVIAAGTLPKPGDEVYLVFSASGFFRRLENAKKAVLTD